ncbi:hypothetical protein [Kitasatospora sp. NPDC059571]|uniref:hypothetical protein n=1 Tax=Kitasatospora sp. NPDC059571 TaxID=3346871 RepID=UPI0036CC7AD5
MTRSSTSDPARARRRLLPTCLVLLVGLALLQGGDGRAFRPLLEGVWAGLGALLGLQSAHLAALLTGRLAGAPVTAVLGFGPRLAEFTVGPITLSVRRVLIPFLCIERVPVAGPALRPRLWLATLLASAVQIALGVWLITLPSPGRSLAFGVLFLAVVSLVAVWQPMSAGWMLLRMPFLPRATADGLALGADGIAAVRAHVRGDLAKAEAALGPLAADRVPGGQEYLLRAGIAEARGRYEESATLARAAASAVVGRARTAQAHLQLAGAFVGAAETGELPPAGYLPQLEQAVAAAGAAFPALLRHSPAPAWLALLNGEREEALSLARRAAGQATGPLARAQAECALAAALAGVGRTDEARQAVGRARALCPELARIAAVEGRIGLLTVEPAG